jgi:uncharacterized Zn finger protein (UPF0148 family)
MQTVSCPSCGAPVVFRSHAAVMAVCDYCRAAVVKDADSVAALGKVSEVLEDYSPIQIGTAGVFAGRTFTVVGRIQLRYEHGMWNEWYLLYDDSTTAWLGDASGQYTLTTARPTEGALPAFEDVEPGQACRIGGGQFTVADKRESECIGGQGELPFRVGDGYRIRTIDLRQQAAFITLDYSDGPVPIVYNGMAVTLPELKCQLLRDEDQIKEKAGRYRGKLTQLDCPSCGSPISYLPGVTSTLVCPACSAQLDAAGPQATVLAKGESVDKVLTTLQLGATAMINGSTHTVIGAMVRADDEGETWTEYLVFSAKESFFWLVETDEGWSRAQVLSTWPATATLDTSSVTLDKTSYDKLYDYTATVQYAAGAFNWRVNAGDAVQVHEFESGQHQLAAELTDTELTWSRSSPVAFDQIKTWFGAGMRGMKPAASVFNKPATLGGTQMKFIFWILGLNAIPLLFNFGESIWIILGALVALYYPASYFQGEDEA